MRKQQSPYLQFVERGLPGPRALGAGGQAGLAQARPHGLQAAAVLRVRGGVLSARTPARTRTHYISARAGPLPQILDVIRKVGLLKRLFMYF